VVNEAFVRRLFPNQSPIGKQFYTLPTKRSFEIVGIARNAQDHSLRWGPISRFYIPFDQALETPATVNFELRTGVDPKALTVDVQRTIAEVDSTLPVLSINTLDERIDRSLLDERLIAGLSGFFAALALLLSSVGLYGVMSFNAVRRTSEIGIRMALGARRASRVEPMAALRCE
jgi:hypothetical protein